MTSNSVELEKLYKDYGECKLKYIDANNEDNLKDLKVIKRKIEDIEIIPDKTGYKPYPDFNNPNFTEEISSKQEFNYTKNEFNINSNPCNTDDFELGNHQIFLKNFMNNKTPYKGLLLYHGVGTGKTCSAVSIAENFRDIYGRQNKKDVDNRIIVLVPNSNVENGWRRNIFDINKGENQCSGDTFIHEYEDKGKDNDPDTINKKVNKIINKYYVFYGYREFANKIEKLIESGIPKPPERLKGAKEIDYYRATVTLPIRKAIIKKLFSNKLLIIDEVHNLRSSTDDSTKESLNRVKEIVENANNLKLVLLSATPMFDNKSEIIWFINILLLNDKREPIDKSEIFSKDGEFTSKGQDLLKKKCRGYISYLRGENPVSFPIRLYPSDNGDPLCYDPKKKKKKLYLPYPINDISGVPITDNKIQFTKLYFNKYQGPQLDHNVILHDGKVSLDLNEQGIRRKKSNIVFPGGKNFVETFDNSNGVYKYKDPSNDFLKYNIDDIRNKRSKKVQDKVKPKTLKDYSIKIHNILKCITKSKGIIFIFSNYLGHGCMPMALALERYGFKKYGNKNIYDGKHDNSWYIDADGRITETKTKHRASYILLTGNSSNKASEIDALRSDDNKNGEKVKIIIGSPTVAEGLDFKRIREIHIMDPWYNLNKLEQIIGRGIRFCSHNDLKQIYRNVTVYLHAGYMKEKESIDFYIYKDAERKALEMGEVEKILKESAIDCYLNKDINHIEDKDVTKVNLESSQGINTSIKPSDKKHTKICSFLKDCKIDCNVEEPNFIDKSTIDYNFLKDILKKIEKFIKEKFLVTKQPFFKINTIINNLKEYYGDKYDETIIKKTLIYMINNKTEIINNNRINGYLIIKNEYIVFQPNNEIISTSIYNRRSIKKPRSKNDNINLHNKYPDKIIPPNPNKGKKGLIINLKNAYDYIDTLFTTMSPKKYNELKLLKDEEPKTIISNGLTINNYIILYIIDTFDQQKKENLLELLINDYETSWNAPDITDKGNLLNLIYNHLRFNFIYNQDDTLIILKKDSEEKPIGYFYKKTPIIDKMVKFTDDFLKENYTFKIKEEDKFNPIIADNLISIYEYLKKNKKIIEDISISKNTLYGYTTYKQNAFTLKIYNNPQQHTKVIFPGNIIEVGQYTNLKCQELVLTLKYKYIGTKKSTPDEELKKLIEFYIKLLKEKDFNKIINKFSSKKDTLESFKKFKVIYTYSQKYFSDNFIKKYEDYDDDERILILYKEYIKTVLTYKKINTKYMKNIDITNFIKKKDKKKIKLGLKDTVVETIKGKLIEFRKEIFNDFNIIEKLTNKKKIIDVIVNDTDYDMSKKAFVIYITILLLRDNAIKVSGPNIYLSNDLYLFNLNLDFI